jgi:transcriptional regulator with XRE-family HTH domain
MPRKQQLDRSFGKRLADLRKARGLTQVQLAQAADTTQRAISYYENEAGYPPAPAVIALAKALRVTSDELLGLRTPRADHAAADPETRRLWKKFQQVATLPEKDQRAVIRLINSLAT